MPKEGTQKITIIRLKKMIYFPNRIPLSMILPEGKIPELATKRVILSFTNTDDTENETEAGILCNVKKIKTHENNIELILEGRARVWKIPLDSSEITLNEINVIRDNFKNCSVETITRIFKRVVNQLNKIQDINKRIGIASLLLLENSEEFVDSKVIEQIQQLLEDIEGSSLWLDLLQKFALQPQEISLWIDKLLNLSIVTNCYDHHYACLIEPRVIKRLIIFSEKILPQFIEIILNKILSHNSSNTSLVPVTSKATKNEAEEFAAKIKTSKMPPEACEESERELSKLRGLQPTDSEYGRARSYLDWMTELPWEIFTQDNLDVNHVKKVLDDDHAFLNPVKERLLEHIAVKNLNPDSKGLILCFVGPPGTGKTSIAKSVAKALGRKKFRASLGGMRDPSEINGHKRTYVGALPGRIIEGLRKAKSQNPVIIFDELDKFGQSFQGDPGSALLEVMDPEQNYEFRDYYLGVSCDLSKVIFITTANSLDPIPPALKDRMEIIEFHGYTNKEKLTIAKKFLIPQCEKECGLLNRIHFSDNALSKIIENYIEEKGVRKLKEKLQVICRKIALEIVKNEKKRRLKK